MDEVFLLLMNEDWWAFEEPTTCEQHFIGKSIALVFDLKFLNRRLCRWFELDMNRNFPSRKSTFGDELLLHVPTYMRYI